MKPQPVSYGITEDTGGHIAYVLAAAEAQARAAPDCRITIVTRAFDEAGLGADHALAQQTINDQIEIVRLRTGNSGYLAKEALVAELPALEEGFVQYIDELAVKPDVCHAHFADAAKLACAVRREFGIPFLFTPHSLALDKARHSDETSPALAQRIARERHAVAEADAIIVSSADECERQLAAYNPVDHKRIHVIAPGSTLEKATGTVNAEELLAPHLDTRSKPIILAIARPVEKKNLRSLVHAYGQSAELQRHANLVILAGQHDSIRSGNDEQSRNLAELFELRRSYRLEGKLALPARHDTQTVAQLYKYAAKTRGVFVNPAKHEPFGLTLLEAAEAELPVVATRNGGPSAIVGELGAGSLIDPDDHSAITRACLSYVTDEKLRAKCVDTANRNLHRFSWDRWALRSLEVMEPLSACRRQPLHEVREFGFEQLLLACDMDDTLTGSADAGKRFASWRVGPRARQVRFTIATGREIDDAISVHRQWGLPQPDVWITSVGSEIHRRDRAGGLSQCEDYARLIGNGWDRAAIERILQKAEVSFQPTINQRGFKISLFGTAIEAKRLKSTLRRAGLAANVIASHGRFIDILPERAGKGAAVLFEANRRGIPARNVISAGNSGNDIELLTLASHAIMVANALPELALPEPHRDLYRSRLPYADGVLEGVSRAMNAMDARPQSSIEFQEAAQ